VAGDVEFKAALDMGDVAAALATLPQMTGKEAKKAVALMDKAFQKAAREAAKLGKAQKSAAREAATANKDLAEGMKGLAELAGVSGDKFEKISKVLAGMSNPLSAIGVSAGAALVAVGGLAAGIVGIVQASEELATKLEPYREIEAFAGLDQSSIDSIHDANAAMDSMVVAGEAAVVLLGGQFADDVEAAATGLLTLELAAVDVLSGLDGIGESKVFKAFMALNPLAGATAAAFDAAAIGIDDYRAAAEETIETTKKLREEQKAEKANAEEAAQAKRDQAAAQRQAASAAREEAAALSSLIGISDSATASQLEGVDLVLFKRDQELAKIEELAAAQMKSAEVQAAADAARLEVIAATEMEIAAIRQTALDAEIADDARREEMRAASHDAQLARIEAERAAEVAASQEKLATAGALLASLDALSSAATDAYIEGKGKESEAAKKAAARQFKLSKALNIAMAAINGAQALLSSIATLGPPVWPNVLGIAGAVAATGIATASSIAIGATPAPTFHTGGMIGHGGQNQPDEVTIRAKASESVLNSAATARLGESGVNALNRGDMPSGRLVVVQQYKHRVFDAIVQDSARMPGSSLRKATKRGDRVGHRNR